MARKIPTAVLAALTFLVLLALPAGAQVAPDGNLTPDTPASAWLTVNNTVVTALIGAVIPLVNGFLLRPSNPGWVKVLLSQVVATVAHSFSQVIQEDGTAFLTQEWVMGLLLTSAAMVGAYLGVWKPAIDPNATIPTGIESRPVGSVHVGGG